MLRAIVAKLVWKYLELCHLLYDKTTVT